VISLLEVAKAEVRERKGFRFVGTVDPRLGEVQCGLVPTVKNQ
jgi:hypothetical protein